VEPAALGPFETLNHHPSFTSRFVDPRPVDVWLPPGYAAEESARRFAVIYMHDGQNLFDPQKAYAGVDWGIGEAIVRLSQAGTIREAIVVGIWNTQKRWPEYMPQKALDGPEASSTRENLAKEPENAPISDLYLRFIVEEVKPFVDSEYRTLPGRENTVVMGSSMGGLASLHALCEYPETFGGAACLSTHWPAASEALLAYLARALPRPGRHRLYFDYGTEDVDAEYEPHQMQADAVMRAAGYREGIDWMTVKFPGAGHSERAWRERVQIPLQFLLKGRPD
jgi:predicted alpha/beta superfamily hydrolase